MDTAAIALRALGGGFVGGAFGGAVGVLISGRTPNWWAQVAILILGLAVMSLGAYFERRARRQRRRTLAALDRILHSAERTPLP